MTSKHSIVWAGTLLMSFGTARAIPAEEPADAAGQRPLAPSSALQKQGEDAWQQRVGAGTVLVLGHPDKIEAYRVSWDNRAGEQIVDSSRSTLSPALMQRLVQLMRDKRAHAGREPIKCRQSLVLYRFWKEKQSVDVRVYFPCAGISIVDTHGHTIEQSGFRSVYPQMVQLAKAALPADTDIQSLKQSAPPVSIHQN